MTAVRTIIKPDADGAYRGCRAVTDKVNQFGKNNNPVRSDGVVTSGTYRVKHTMLRAAYGLRVVYTNLNVDDSQVDTITVRGGIEADGLLWPVWFGGRRDVVIEPSSMVVSDPVPVSAAQAAVIYSRSFVSVTAGQRWPIGHLATLTVNGEGNNAGNPGSDMTTSGTVPTAQAFTYSPFAILAEHTTPEKVPMVCVVGDSLCTGEATVYSDQPSGDAGFVSQALQDGHVGYVNPSRTGEKAADYAAAPTTRNLQFRRSMVFGCTHAICALGVNDVVNAAPLATMQANLTTIWNLLVSAGCRVFQTTITPVTTSTDGWATTGNQTVTANESRRTALNDWIRTVPAPLSGVFEVADTVETSRNSGIWKAPGYTSGGLHPTFVGHTAMSAGIDASRIVA